jgi:hypothetical protein
MLENGCIYSERELTDKATVENLTDMQAEVEETIKKLNQYYLLLGQVKAAKILG